MIGVVYIIGNPRSGTSLLRLMITSHPNIVIPPESHFFLWLEDKYGNWPQNDDIEIFLDDLFNSRKFETWGMEKAFIRNRIKENNPSNYSELISLIYTAYGEKIERENIKYWGDKNKLWKEKLPLVKKHFPQAKYIHIFRDGRDVACSYKALFNKQISSQYAPNLPHEINDIAMGWKTNINFIANFLKKLPVVNCLEVRYEDLILDTRRLLRTITEFLNVDFSPSMFGYKEMNAKYQLEPPEFLKWKGKLISDPDPKNIGKYRTELTGQEISAFERICNGQLKKYGYL